MSNLQTPDARTALMQSVILSRHLQASPARISPSSPLRRPSRIFNVQDFAGHRKQVASPSKRKAREDNIALAIRGRTIYNSRVNPATPKTRSPRKNPMKPTAPSYHPLGTGALSEEKTSSLDILQRMEAEEEHREKDQGFLVEARGGSPSYQAEDKSLWMGVSESDADYHMPRGSEQGTPSSDMEHSPSRWNAPKFNSGEGDWETMFDMYIKEQECMEAMML
ncbi:hypothetical protein DFJ58DRAFT_773440 [Suillus subalutaceus]|uniref:uncharacterized protein n=1 Tax=Suillus subalutaceus TaxID=48586 RepID=UPI001B87A8BC|nr:uncharacterized protein DFJ58DRAFT_773440 [Suillus subalutaceus]KAG1864298.1 hypothetical protein DFJ58DRAFT_773440 [Suillus subalutaceus]